MKFDLTELQIADYRRDGYLIVKGLFNPVEIGRLYHVVTEDVTISDNAYDVNDESGKRSKLTLWFNPGNDIYGLVSRSQRMVNAIDKLLEGNAPICHFHSKLMQKEPKAGVAWEWHQDYRY